MECNAAYIRIVNGNLSIRCVWETGFKRKKPKSVVEKQSYMKKVTKKHFVEYNGIVVMPAFTSVQWWTTSLTLYARAKT